MGKTIHAPVKTFPATIKPPPTFAAKLFKAADSTTLMAEFFKTYFPRNFTDCFTTYFPTIFAVYLSAYLPAETANMDSPYIFIPIPVITNEPAPNPPTITYLAISTISIGFKFLVMF